MKKVNIKRIISVILGIMTIGTLVSCGEGKETGSEASKPVVIAIKENMKFVNVDGEEKKYVINGLSIDTAANTLINKVHGYIREIGVKEEQGQYTNSYYGHKLDEKYGKSDWILNEKYSEGEGSVRIINKYMFDKELLTGNIDIKDTDITEFIKVVIQVPLTDEEIKSIQEKFNVFQTSDTGTDIIRINQEDTYYSIIL